MMYVMVLSSSRNDTPVAPFPPPEVFVLVPLLSSSIFSTTVVVKLARIESLMLLMSMIGFDAFSTFSEIYEQSNKTRNYSPVGVLYSISVCAVFEPSFNETIVVSQR